MRVVFRADASLQIGTGHVMRCLSLANTLRAEGAYCKFITRNLTGHLGETISDQGFEVTLLPAPIDEEQEPLGPPYHAPWAKVGWERDAKETRAAIEDPSDWLVLDHYAFDARWEAAACPIGMRLMVIDDLADRPHCCDLLLDQSLGRKVSDYDGLVRPEATRLIGPQYALLRPEFSDMRSEALSKRDGRGFRELMISLGGVDATDVTSKVLGALSVADLPKELHISVIMGASAPALEKVQEIAKTMPCPTIVSVDVSNMAERMANADLAIGAGGSTTWERCTLGLPSLMIVAAKNQSEIVAAIEGAGAGVALDNPTVAGFSSALRRTFHEVCAPSRLSALSELSAEICDGDGTKRVLSKMQTPTISFRSAFRSDSRRVWEWRRAADQSFYRSGPIKTYAEHDRWFCQAVSDKRRIIYIALLGSMPCGYCRLDLDRLARAKISLCLSPEVRGIGLGHSLLKEAHILAHKHEIGVLEAQVNERNLASRAIFDAADYVRVGREADFLVYRRVFEEQR